MATVERTLHAYMEGADNTNQPNVIHSTEGARQFGYRDALVTGSVAYGWCVPTILEAMGEGWLQHGWIEVDFRRPVYPHHQLAIRLEPIEGDVHSFTVHTDDGGLAMNGTVGLGEGEWIADFHEREPVEPVPAPAPPPLLTLDIAPVGEDLPALLSETSASVVKAPADLVPADGRAALLVGGEAIVSPGALAGRMSWYLHSLYDYAGPSIHVSTRFQHDALVPAGQPIIVAGHMREAFERKGHHYTVTDGTFRAVDGTRLGRARHTVIFKVAPRT